MGQCQGGMVKETAQIVVDCPFHSIQELDLT